MKKLTKSEQIESLEKELKLYKELLEKAYNTIDKMQEQADIEFANSCYRKQLEDSNQMLQQSRDIKAKLLVHAEEKLFARDERIEQLEQENKTLKMRLNLR